MIKTSRFFWKRVAGYPYVRRLYPTLLEAKKTIPTLSKEINITSSYLNQIINENVADDFIKKTKHKNTFIIELTEKGKILAELCLGITKVADDYDENTREAIISNMKNILGGKK